MIRVKRTLLIIIITIKKNTKFSRAIIKRNCYKSTKISLFDNEMFKLIHLAISENLKIPFFERFLKSGLKTLIVLFNSIMVVDKKADPTSCKVILAGTVSKDLLAEVSEGLSKLGKSPSLVGFLANTDPAARRYAEWTDRTCREKWENTFVHLCLDVWLVFLSC